MSQDRQSEAKLVEGPAPQELAGALAESAECCQASLPASLHHGAALVTGLCAAPARLNDILLNRRQLHNLKAAT